MSDIIRNDILIKNGGLWIDSTVLLTDNIPDFITELDFLHLSMNTDMIKQLFLKVGLFTVKRKIQCYKKLKTII